MKKLNLISLILILFIFSMTSLYSETAEDRLLSKREKRILTYTYQAKVGSRDNKLTVLDNILNEYSEQNYTKEDKKLLDLAIYLSEEGITRQEFENNRLINDFPEVRRKACILLGKLGGDEARNALINILEKDTNQHVKAEACNALALVGDNERGDVLKTIVYSYRNTYNPDPNFVLAIINAVKTLAKNSYNAAYGDALYILTEIQVGHYNNYIRTEAYNAIKFLNSE